LRFNATNIGVNIIIEEIFADVKKQFPEVDARLVPVSMKSFMLSSPNSNKIYYDPQQLIKYNFSRIALTGMMAHEFSHKVDYMRMSWLERLMIRWKYKRNLDFKRRLERDADMITIDRGYGSELIQSIKETESRFEKERFLRFKLTHLSLKEIETKMKKKK